MKFRLSSKATASDWEDVPGWNKAEQKYEDLDCERWIRENRIREAGRENGKEEYPRSDAVQRDEMHEKIRAWINHRALACHDAVSEYLVSLRHTLEMETKEGMAPIHQRVEGLREEGILKLTDRGETDGASLARLRSEARDAEQALAGFRKRAKLDRVAEYGARDTWYWWLIGVVVVEAVINATMLAGVHQYGLLGSLFVMLGIGLVNAALLAGVMGLGWRLKNVVETPQRVVGWTLAGAGLFLLFGWNLLVGHFRDSMFAATTRAGGSTSLEALLRDDTITRFLSNPWGLEGMQSWILAAVGCGAGLLAAWKWLGIDDPYPGYGRRHRAAKQLHDSYLAELETRRARLHGVWKDYTERIRDQEQQLQNKKGNWEMITGTARRIVRSFPMHLRQYQDDLDFLIAAYRAENEKARSTPSPDFFAENLQIDPELLQVPEWEGTPKSTYDEDWAGFREAEEALRDTYRGILADYQGLEEGNLQKRSEQKEGDVRLLEGGVGT